MRCRLKSFLFLVVLLFSVLSSLFSEITLSETDYQMIMEALNHSESQLIEQEKQITTLENQLKSSEIIIENQEKLQNILDQQIVQQEKALSLHEKYLKEQKKETLWTNIKGFLLGVLAGGVILNVLYTIQLNT